MDDPVRSALAELANALLPRCSHDGCARFATCRQFATAMMHELSQGHEADDGWRCAAHADGAKPLGKYAEMVERVASALAES